MFFAASAGRICCHPRPAQSWPCRSSTPTIRTRETRERRTVLAGSAFLALVDVFFVSIVALTGGAAVFADIQPRDGDGRLAGHQPLECGERSGPETSPAAFQLARSEPRLRSHFGRGLFNPTRPCHCAPGRRLTALLCSAHWCWSSWGCLEVRWDEHGRSPGYNSDSALNPPIGRRGEREALDGLRKRW